ANTSVATNRRIKIYTLYALKLDSLIEFRDGNGNNIADYARAYNSTTCGFTDYYARLTDTLYKKADLRTNWTRSPIVEANGTTYRNWTFSLSAQNLTYAPVANYTGSVAGVLPLVRFTFHLNASLEQVDNASVPQWRVTVGTVGGNTVVTDISRMANLDFTGNSTRIADLVWVGTSTVDGVAQPVFGEVVGGFRLTAIGERGNAFVGFVLLAGLSFRGGASIIHDPTVTTDIQADLQLP